jgi:hypothetical protein
MRDAFDKELVRAMWDVSPILKEIRTRPQVEGKEASYQRDGGRLFRSITTSRALNERRTYKTRGDSPLKSFSSSQLISARKCNFEGKVAFVTGDGTGIGRAAALAFARAGASVAVADIGEQANEETARLIEQEGGRAVAVRCDVTKADEVKAALDRRRPRARGGWRSDGCVIFVSQLKEGINEERTIRSREIVWRLRAQVGRTD